MARKRNNKKFEYARRLKDLKQKLKPYRDSHTVNLLRVITGSSGVNLNNYWESLESVLMGDHSYHEVKERIQSIVNRILENGEHAKSTAPRANLSVEVVENKLTHLHINSKANVFDSWSHINIDSKTNMFDNAIHGNIDSKANVFDNVRYGNIDSKANVFAHMENEFIDSKANLINKLKHLHIDNR